MGAFLDTPKTEKKNEEGAGNGLKYGLGSMQGWRVEMEDAHTMEPHLPGKMNGWAFFSVFDGHAGSMVAEESCKHLLPAILSTSYFDKLTKENAPFNNLNITENIRSGFLSYDEQLRSNGKIDSGEDKSGSTVVSVFISDHHVIFANCGDSRGILVRDGKVHFATLDHKPCNPSERERIQNAGGSVMISRVNGSLAVSRSLGDFDYKRVDGKSATEQLVSPEPDVTIIERDPAKDQFIILACDGVWDVMSNEEVCDYIQNRLKSCNNLSAICNQLIDNSLHRGSRDNISVILIVFPGAPKVDPQMQAKDKELDKQITNACHDYFQEKSVEDPDVSALATYISSLNFEGYPPGGPVTKRYIIEDVFAKSTAKVAVPQNR